MNKWSLNGKILFIVSIFVIACGAISFVGITRMGTLKETIDTIVDRDSKRLAGVLDLKATFESVIIAEKNMILDDTKEGTDKFAALAITESDRFDTQIQGLIKIASVEGKKNLEEIVQVKKEFMATHDEIAKLSQGGDDKAAYKLSAGRGRDMRLKVEGLVEKIVERNKKRMEEASNESDALYANARNLMILTSVLAVLIGAAISFVVMRALSKAIDQVINSLTDNSNQVTSAAHQIASSSVELSQSATEQSASLEQTSASIEELSSMVQKNADNAKKTTQISEHSKESAGRGKEVVQEMITAIHEINESNDAIKVSIDESNKRISEIVDVINEIGNKTKVINDIVFQTKLLSFNASVEAARAGEHGKGFAVVAEEVGNLAQMSGNAAKEISSMLDASISKVESIVKESKEKIEILVREGHNKVEKGTRIAQECGTVLDDIVKNISNVNQMSEEISVASQEQAQGVNEITKAMSQLDQVTQTNAAASEQAAQAAEELSAQAESLRSMVGVLVETIKGAQGAAQKTAFDYVPAKTEASTKKESKVLPMKKASKPTAVPVKKASGDFVPNHSDTRFEEV